MNFVIHYRVLFAGKFDLIKSNREFHFYLGVLLVAVLLAATVLYVSGLAPEEQIKNSYRHKPLTETALQQKIDTEEAKISSPPGILRYAAFQIVSITTTTGYTTADSDIWPNFIRFILVLLMFFGGCAGSTGVYCASDCGWRGLAGPACGVDGVSADGVAERRGAETPGDGTR